MPKFTIHTRINKPVEIVYQAFIDSNNMLKWAKDLERTEVIKGTFGEVDATMHL